jgi:hypothetical protein
MMDVEIPKIFLLKVCLVDVFMVGNYEDQVDGRDGGAPETLATAGAVVSGSWRKG